MADPEETKPKAGCLTRLLVMFLLVCGLGIVVALGFIAQPQDLAEIEGYRPAEGTADARDLARVLRNSLDRGFPLTLTEGEINRWLGRTLDANQGGLLAGQVSLERLWIRLHDGHAELILERRVAGRPFTVSMFLTVEQLQDRRGVIPVVHLQGGLFHPNLPRPPRGGRFGKLVVPQGFLHLVKPAFAKLAPLFENEIHLAIEEMARVRIENKRLVLDPRGPEDEFFGLPSTF